MERMEDLTQQYVEQLNNMVKDLREKKLELEEENKNLKDYIVELEDELYAWKSMFRNLRRNSPKLYKEARNYMAFEDNQVCPPPNGKWEC